MVWHVSMRYFLAHKRQSLVCIAGVTISVTMYVAMSALMAGFSDKFIIETVESSGHISIGDEPRESRTPILEQAFPDPDALRALVGSKPRDQVKKIKNPDGVLGKLRRLPGVIAAAPEVTGQAIVSYGTKEMSLSIIGVEPEAQTRVTTIGQNIIEGDFSRLRATADGLVIGRGVSLVLGARLDDVVTLVSPNGGRTTARVIGVFETGVTPVDYSRAYMLINNAQTLLDRKNVINRITIRTDDYNKAEEYARQIESIVGYKTESWQESNSNFLKIFRVQEVITTVITGSLLVVAAFGVLNILIMAVLERINDIAILRSFGLSRLDITRIYLIQGLVIGLVGAVGGLACGKALVEGLRRLPIPVEGLVKTEGLLMSEHPHHYYMAFISAMVVVALAAMYPARRAAGYDPVEVIRGAH